MYELLFWNYIEGIYLNHHEVYEAIIEEQSDIDGLEELPVQIILNRIAKVFLKWEKVDERSWKNNDGLGAFHIRTTPQSIKIDCYGTEGKTMDTLVNIMEEFNCALYDPQVPQRYDDMAE
ncbi:hypothetical protein SAMN05444396_10439 [Flavobacterium segetis]|uniref:Uncharacterized protein n=1 Tax=Flavobacterium segetis TaxID=271157 RepID=A0A1M5GNN0_9FLAO|nr:hypothetical protein [Flavobacterium segetis]SHG05122.1 hypothetical protein SAMN05444396_10439 [Flavobacterium segetis]